MSEKFIEWSDNRYPIPLNTILSITSFYWFTNSFERALWPYRLQTSMAGSAPDFLKISLTKPFGYSWYRSEITVLPRTWAEHLFPNLVFHKTHDKVCRFCLRWGAEILTCFLGRTLCGAGAARTVS